MTEFKSLIFWYGGVLVEDILSLMLSIARPEATGEQRSEFRQLLQPQLSALMLGNMSSKEFCEHVITASQSDHGAHHVEQVFVENLSPRRPVLDIIRAIPDSYQRWLICDVPTEWFKPHVKALEETGLFSPENVLRTSDLGDGENSRDFASAISNSTGVPKEQCLVVDANSARAVQNVRNGLPTIIYVYPDRLKHELALQKILETGSEVLHPSSSERVHIP